MKRLSLSFITLILILTLTLLTNSRPVSAGTAASTATPGPTLAPSATPNTVTIQGTQVYFHSSGMMSVPQPGNWPLAAQNAEELTLPNSGSEITRAGVTFINTDALSVVHSFVENVPSRPITSTIALDKVFDQEYWNGAWSNYTGGWKETSRRNDGRRFVVDFDLFLEGATYRGRQVSRVENKWLIVLRLVGPKDNPRLIEDLDKAVWPGITLYPDAANTPSTWTSIIDQTAGYMIRVPQDWQAIEAVPGKPFVINGTANGVPVTIRTMVEPGKMARIDQVAQLWVKAIHKDAKILSTEKEPRTIGSGMSVAYSTHDESGAPASGLAVLLNGPGYTLFSADILVSREGLQPVGIDNMNPVLKQLHNSLIVFPPKQAVYGGASVLLPSRTPMPTGTPTQTPMPTATLDPGSFDISSAQTYTSPDSVLSLSLPRGWNTLQQSSEFPFYLFYLGDTPDQFSRAFQIVVGDLDKVGLSPEETVSGDPQQILEAIKKQAVQSDPGAYGNVEETKIGSIPAYGLQGRVPQPAPGITLNFELRLAKLTPSQWVYVSAAGTDEDWSRLQAVFNKIMDSVKINVDRLPQASPTAVPF